uniref:HTH marR-type domain-containing protein n=1 Tax=uncultured prokaryote TaxID=198431 RepID=A0A0H5Q658_9ZZZZ|nr:hypothetical protein [uncultured prokaryote]
MAMERQKRGMIDESRSFDPKTGEVQEGSMVWVPKPSKSQFGTDWFKMAQTTLKVINQHRKELGLEGIVVFNSLMARLDFQNFIQVSQAEIAEELDMKPSNVSRAVKRLIEHGFVKVGPKVGRSSTYQLHPELVWKGKNPAHFKARETARSQGWKVIKGGKDKPKAITSEEQPDLPFPL